MGLFNSKSSKRDSSSKRRDIFDKYGGKLTREQFKRHMWNVPMRTVDKEYVKRVMEKFDVPYYSRGITKEEFHKGLDQMLKNTRDPIGRRGIERLKKYFERPR